MNELIIPPAAKNDPESFEILRVWAANEEQHITIESDLNGDESDFGFMIADLALHGVRLYAEKLGKPVDEIKNNLLEGFLSEYNNESSEITGGMSE